MILLLILLRYSRGQLSMRELMAKYNTDKGDKGFGHAYYRQYEKLFAPFRTSRVRLLEIGVDGGNSMGLWKVSARTKDGGAHTITTTT
jgi:hypothetical protein